MITILLSTLASLAIGSALGWFICRHQFARQIEELAPKLASGEERIRSLQENRDHLTNDLENLKQEGTLLQKTIGDLREETAQLKERVSRTQKFELDLEESQRDLEQARTAESSLREALGRLESERKVRQELLDSTLGDLRSEKSQRENAEKVAAKLQADLAELNEKLRGERQTTAEKLSLLQDAKTALSDQFKSLANDILDEKSKRFLEQNQASLGELLGPLKTKLGDFQTKIETIYGDESKDRSALGEQVRQLIQLNQAMSEDAKNLTRALKGSSKTQGNWGELILERILEAAGLQRGEEYEVQESHTREDGTRAQPDVIIHLPEERHLVVDAKVSLTAYEELSSEEDEERRKDAAKRHIASIRTHIKGLSEKNYQDLYKLNSLDFVVMFVPIEPAFMLAVTTERDLWMDAWQKNVLLVSPSSLLFVVRTVAHLWRQEAQSRNAQEIAKRGAELYDRLSAFTVDLEKVGERLNQAQESFSDARNKLSRNRGNVIRQAQMLKEMGIKPTKTIPSKLIEASLDEEESMPSTLGIDTPGEGLDA